MYFTSSFKSAAHYSGANKDADTHYVYTVEIPEITESNHIAFKHLINPDIVVRAQEKLGCAIPEKVALDGKDFRKFLAKKLGGGSDVQSEKLASEFLSRIGVDFITWPYNWKNPALGLNVAVLDNNIKIVKIDQVELDANQQLIVSLEKEMTVLINIVS